MKKGLVLLLVAVAYLFFVTFSVKPWEFRHFSLIDDPISLIETSQYYDDCTSQRSCGQFFQQIFETNSKRFRPVYWLINTFLYKLAGGDPQVIHLTRYYILGLIATLAISWVSLSLGGGYLAVILASLLFFISPSFTENTVRLGTPELYLVIIISALSLLYLNCKKTSLYYWIFFVLLLCAFFVKESAIAIAGAVLLTDFYKQGYKFDKRILLIGFFTGFMYLIGTLVGSRFPANTLANFPEYTLNYSFSPAGIFSSLTNNLRLLMNLATPFLKIDILLIVILMLTESGRKFLLQKKIVYIVTLALAFFLVLVPWKYVLDRYYLVILGNLFIFSGLVIEKTLIILRGSKYLSKKLTGAVFWLCSILIVSNIFFKNFAINYPQTANYSEWFKVFTEFESSQVQILTQYPQDNIFLNATSDLDNLEIVYGIPLQLKYLYGQTISVSQLPKQLPDQGLILSRSSVVPVIDPKLHILKNRIMASECYAVKQIDPLRFRDNFLYRPVESLTNPPYKDASASYCWYLTEI